MKDQNGAPVLVGAMLLVIFLLSGAAHLFKNSQQKSEQIPATVGVAHIPAGVLGSHVCRCGKEIVLVGRDAAGIGAGNVLTMILAGEEKSVVITAVSNTSLVHGASGQPRSYVFAPPAIFVHVGEDLAAHTGEAIKRKK